MPPGLDDLGERVPLLRRQRLMDGRCGSSEVAANSIEAREVTVEEGRECVTVELLLAEGCRDALTRLAEAVARLVEAVLELVDRSPDRLLLSGGGVESLEDVAESEAAEGTAASSTASAAAASVVTTAEASIAAAVVMGKMAVGVPMPPPAEEGCDAEGAGRAEERAEEYETISFSSRGMTGSREGTWAVSVKDRRATR